MVHSQSLTGVITPVKTPALKRIGQSISVTSLTSTVTPAVALSSLARAQSLCPARSAPSVFAARRGLCPRPTSASAPRPRLSLAGGTASAGATP